MKPKKHSIASFFYKVSEICVVPLRFLLNDIIGRLMTVLKPSEFGNAKTVVAEVFIRIGLAFLILPIIVPVVITAILWVVFRFIGDICLGKQNFLLLKGNYKGPGTKTFATWNVASFLPPCTLVDGVAYSKNRTKLIAAQLKDFHFVCSQEMGGPEARLISKLLKNDFAEFYAYIGKSHTPMLQSGLFFASKELVLNAYWYPYTVPNVQKTINRSYAVFELQNYYVAITHPDSAVGPAGEAVRLAEMQQMLATLATFTDKPIIFCADLNDDWYNPEAKAYQLLIQQFPDLIGNAYPGKKFMTDTNLLFINRLGKKDPVQNLSIDFFGANKPIITYLGTDYFYYLTDHNIMKGQIL